MGPLLCHPYGSKVAQGAHHQYRKLPRKLPVPAKGAGGGLSLRPSGSTSTGAGTGDPILKSTAMGLSLNSMALGLSFEVRGAGRGVLSGGGEAAGAAGGSAGCAAGSVLCPGSPADRRQVWVQGVGSDMWGTLDRPHAELMLACS